MIKLFRIKIRNTPRGHSMTMWAQLWILILNVDKNWHIFDHLLPLFVHVVIERPPIDQFLK
jgi:hypothetical protein